MWYCVPLPKRYHGTLALLGSRVAPLTRVPALPSVPVDATRVGKVNGWPWLSVRLALMNQNQSPL